jgi:hypothetical protein
MKRTLTATACLLALSLAATALAKGVNSSIRFDSGSQIDGESTVNGSITVGSNSVVNGSLQTVNGAIRIDDAVQLGDAGTVNGSITIGSAVIIEDIESVNGTIRIGQNASISGSVSAVNGKIELGSGSTVARDVSNVNGEFLITRSDIGGDLSTVSGDVWLLDGSVLQGDLLVEKPGGWGWGRSRRVPRIVIGPGSRVLGKIEAKREIELYLSDTAEVAEVTGEISLDQAIRFSGERPDWSDAE